MAAAIVALFDSQTGRPVPSGMSLAQLLQQSEQRMVGVQCGILDQFSSMFGRRGHALFLDCDSLAHDAVPFGADPPAIVVCDSRLPRELATGKYNQRRTECEAALAAICRLRGGSWPSLSHVPDRDFELCEEAIPDPLARRARHVLNENRRVRAGLALLKGSGDVRGFGRLMIESHASSRDDFENSLPELDALIEIAIGLPGCWGAKVSGAGWGGCTVNLVDRTHADAFGAGLASKYAARFGNSPRILTCQSAGGAHAVRHDPAES
jgi:galactokinase